MDSEGRIIEVVLSTEFSDYDSRTGDNKTKVNWPSCLSTEPNFVLRLFQLQITQSTCKERIVRVRVKEVYKQLGRVGFTVITVNKIK